LILIGNCNLEGVCIWNVPGYILPIFHSHLIHTVFIGGDGSFRLMRNNKGGGEIADPSLFGDTAFYSPQSEYKDFCRVRGGAPDDQSVRD